MNTIPAGYSARELAELAGTSVRTIHYYTSEGLLPAPSGTTRNAVYGPAHLARLRIIAALREEGLALSKIRERLASLTDEQAERVAEALTEHLATGEDGPLTTLGLLDLEVTRQNLPQSPMPLAAVELAETVSPAALAPPALESTSSARDYLQQLLNRDAPPVYRQSSAASRAPQRPYRFNAPRKPTPEVWYEYELEDGIQLRLREDRYRQAKVRPGALVQSVQAFLHQHGVLRHDNQEDDPGHR